MVAHFPPPVVLLSAQRVVALLLGLLALLGMAAVAGFALGRRR
jgi:hypothetical protein